MTARKTGAVVLGIHLALVCAVAAKYAIDLQTLPRGWAQVEWTPPPKGDEGRYLILRACPLSAPLKEHFGTPVRLRAVSGFLTAEPGSSSDRVRVTWRTNEKPCLLDSVYFYVPKEVSFPAAGTELWAEFSVPENELPRPLRLGTKQNGEVRELSK